MGKCQSQAGARVARRNMGKNLSLGFVWEGMSKAGKAADGHRVG